MERYERFIDCLCALVFFGLLVTNAWIIGLLSTVSACGLLFGLLLFGSGAGMAAMFTHYVALRSNSGRKSD